MQTRYQGKVCKSRTRDVAADDRRRPQAPMEPEGAHAKRETKAKSGKNRRAAGNKDRSLRQGTVLGRKHKWRPEDAANDRRPKELERRTGKVRQSGLNRKNNGRSPTTDAPGSPKASSQSKTPEPKALNTDQAWPSARVQETRGARQRQQKQQFRGVQ